MLLVLDVFMNLAFISFTQNIYTEWQLCVQYLGLQGLDFATSGIRIQHHTKKSACSAPHFFKPSFVGGRTRTT